MKSTAARLQIYDATLREGAQAAGVSFTSSGKLRVARMLDAFGVDYIEGGFAASNPKDLEFFRALKRAPLKQARLVAFGMTCRAGVPAAKDEGLRALLDSGAPALAVVGKASPWQVKHVLRVPMKENVRMIRRSVAFLKAAGREVFFEAEHFFDGFAENAAAALAALSAAADAGADALVLCDTNGGALSPAVGAALQVVRQHFPTIRLGIHTHNDCGLAVANTLAAVAEGATVVQGTVNGFGERTGNADICTLLPVLAFKMHHPFQAAKQLPQLTRLSRDMDEAAGQRPDARRPFVGDNAFTHKGGLHVDGVSKVPESFEQITPKSVGNQRRILLSELSGSGSVFQKTDEMGYALGTDKKSKTVRQVLKRLEKLEQEGYEFESAGASFNLLVEKVLHRHQAYFELLGFSVVVQKRDAHSPATTTATIKVRVGGETELTAGEGKGPVDALNTALRKVLQRFYPEIEDVVLEDYNVRILNPESATGAATRVRIDSSDGKAHWGTVGVSENIIEASWMALVDSVEYKLFRDGVRAASVSRKNTASSRKKK